MYGWFNKVIMWCKIKYIQSGIKGFGDGYEKHLVPQWLFIKLELILMINIIMGRPSLLEKWGDSQIAWRDPWDDDQEPGKYWKLILKQTYRTYRMFRQVVIWARYKQVLWKYLDQCLMSKMWYPNLYNRREWNSQDAWTYNKGKWICNWKA